MREILELDGTWEFLRDPAETFDIESLPRSGEPVAVPGAWESQVAEPWGIVTAWYRRRFVAPDMASGAVIVRFGGVMHECSAWLNGRSIGEHRGGYVPFELDATGALLHGRENELVLRVRNPFNAHLRQPAYNDAAARSEAEQRVGTEIRTMPGGKQDWYSSTSGPIRSVRLEVVPPVRLERVRVDPSLRRAEVRVGWRTSRAGGVEVSGGDPDRVELTVVAPDGSTVAAATTPVADGSVILPIPDPVAWDLGAPNLYHLESRLIAGDRIIDLVTTRFGMRDVSTSDGRIVLNGRPVYVLGVLDQDFHADTLTTPPSRDYLDEQIRLAQQMGFNLIRIHITAPDERYLDAADEAGILAWCELPNWQSFTPEAGETGAATLEAMIEAFGNHPSIVAWTIINEDWGTDLRHVPDQRVWLRRTWQRIKAADPGRLLVDNSACEATGGPNFHVRSDLADFHLYRAQPDHADRWKRVVAEFAGRPAWLWSGHGDAEASGDEPLVLSEFGNWGLPDLDRFRDGSGDDPWWFATGPGPGRPAGLEDRFRAQGLDRAWADTRAMAMSTEQHQFEALQEAIGQIRRHSSISGYVVTELSDIYWEANGLLDLARRPKACHERLADINAPDVVFADLEHRDLLPGGTARADIIVSAWGEPSPAGEASVEWRIDAGGSSTGGRFDLPTWPRHGSVVLEQVEFDVPEVDGPSDGQLRLIARDGTGRALAAQTYRLAILAPPAVGRLSVETADEDLAGRFGELGVEPSAAGAGRLLVATAIDAALLERVAAGGRCLVLAGDPAAIPADLALAAGLPTVCDRDAVPPGVSGDDRFWRGDWISTFAWLDPKALPGLPPRAPLDFAYRHVLPDHVLAPRDGFDWRSADAGLFVGWVGLPAAIVTRQRLGRGSLVVTTFQVGSRRGPLADTLLAALLVRSMADV